MDEVTFVWRCLYCGSHGQIWGDTSLKPKECFICGGKLAVKTLHEQPRIDLTKKD